MASLETRTAEVVSAHASAAWAEHRHHCPHCAMPRLNRGPCLRGLRLRGQAEELAAALGRERDLDRRPTEGQHALF